MSTMYARERRLLPVSWEATFHVPETCRIHEPAYTAAARAVPRDAAAPVPLRDCRLGGDDGRAAPRQLRDRTVVATDPRSSTARLHDPRADDARVRRDQRR